MNENSRSGPKNAVVLLSGGLDSATCLAIAVNEGYTCHTLAVDYGQRHQAELDAAALLSDSMGAKTHRVVNLDLRAIGGSALTDDAIDVPTEGVKPDEIPVTYVPARNTILLGIALGLAETVEATSIWIGVNAVDYSGYPDCRPEFIEQFVKLANLATKAGVEGGNYSVMTPLESLTKAQIIARGLEFGVNYGLTVSCYQADSEGRACGSCDSCQLRTTGFEQAGIGDPTRYVD